VLQQHRARPFAPRTPHLRVHVPAILGRLAANQWILLLLLTVVLAVVAGSVNSRFWTLNNLSSILQEISVLGLVATGATILIISGNFDISVGAALGLAAIAMAMLMNAGVPDVVAVLVGVGVGTACSTFNGVASRLFRAPSFIISLATIGVFHGISLALTGGVIQTIYGRFDALGTARLGGVLPLMFAVTLAGFAAMHLLLTRTRLGRRVFAIGDNPRAAFLAGINVSRNTIIFFVINGVLVGLGAMLMLSRLGGALPSTGTGMELEAIGAAVIGGVPITGGKGSVVGTFFGVLLLGVVRNVLNILQVDPYYQDMAFGGLIILAVAISALRGVFARWGTE
jgi:ribose transport system permease protein